jgi:hypothetical protein
MPGKHGYGNSRKERKESRAHDRSARRTFRKDHTLKERWRIGETRIQKLFQGNKNK